MAHRGILLQDGHSATPLGGPGRRPAGESVAHRLQHSTLAEVAADCRGSFAFIGKDAQGGWLAFRDRLGQQSVYFSESPEFGVGFEASELAGRLAHRAPDEATCAAHLAGLTARGDSFFRGVKALGPGEGLSERNGRASIVRYWRVSPCDAAEVSPDETALAAELRHLLSEIVGEYAGAGAVGQRIAVALSGGLDSPSVAASLPNRSAAVAVRFVAPEVPDADEAEASLAISRALGFGADEPISWPLSLGLGRPLMPQDAPRVLAFSDLWLTAAHRARSAGCGSMMTGLGGDSLFGSTGYGFSDLLLSGRYKQALAELWGRARRDLKGAVTPVRWHLGLALPGPFLRLKNELRLQDQLPWLRRRALDLMCRETAPRKAGLPGARQRYREIAGLAGAPQLSELGRLLEYCGISAIHPLLDHRLVEFSLRLPSWTASHRGIPKWLLRCSMRGLLPDRVLDQEARVTAETIFRRAMLKERPAIHGLLSDMRCGDLGLVEPRQLASAYKGFEKGYPVDARFFLALTLEAWLRETFA